MPGLYPAAALYASYSIVNFTNSTGVFMVNKSSDAGGAIRAASGSEFNFTNSFLNFSKNEQFGTTLYGGGAIWIDGKAKVNFANSIVEFRENVSNGNSYRGSGGGAIFMGWQGSGELNFINSSAAFVNNKVAWSHNYMGGGAIMATFGSTVSFENSNFYFIENSHNSSDGTGERQGGAVNIGSWTVLNIEGSAGIFYGNKAGYGGALFVRLKSIVNITNSKLDFSSNVAQIQSGGAIFLQSWPSAIAGKSFLNVKDSTVNFVWNRTVAADKDGGAIYIANSYAAFSNSIVNFINNAATRYGGAIYANNQDNFFSFIDSTAAFTRNKALTDGGAIYIAASASATFTRSIIKFTSNTAGNYGAAIYIHTAADSRLTVTSSTLNIEYSSSGQRGALTVSGLSYGPISQARFIDSQISFIGNSSYWENVNGAALVVQGFVLFENSTVTFTGNRANNGSSDNSSGGAIWSNNAGGGSMIRFAARRTDSYIYFEDNRANYDGANTLIDILLFNNIGGSSVSFIADPGKTVWVKKGMRLYTPLKWDYDYLNAHGGSPIAVQMTGGGRVVFEG
jgi:predicted outer membrane repeat protein